MKENAMLYVISDSSNMEEDVFLSKIEDVCKGGANLLQLREKTCTTKEYYELAYKVKQITMKYHVPLIIDDRVDIALAIDAQGVHVGSEDMPVRIARALLGPDKIIGATAKTLEHALQAQQDGATYIGVGAIYPTTTKVKTKLTSVETLNDIVQHVSIPVYAIGGLNKDNIAILQGSGIQGICAVSAIMNAQDAQLACQELKQAMIEIL